MVWADILSVQPYVFTWRDPALLCLIVNEKLFSVPSFMQGLSHWEDQM